MAPHLDPPVDPQLDHAKGPANAPVTLVEYADFECPHCGAAYPNVHELERRMGDGLRVVFRHFPLTGRHLNASLAARAAEAAGEQGRFWEMHDRLFEHQDELGPEDLRRHADAVGLDLERFDAALADGRGLARVERDLESGTSSDLPGTPAIFLNGELYDGFYDAESLEAAIEQIGAP